MSNVLDAFLMIVSEGLSLLGHDGLDEVDPVFALPVNVVKRLGLPILYDPEFVQKTLSSKRP